MDDNDYDEVKGKDLMTPLEIREASTLGWIETLRRKRVCLFPGPQRAPHDAGITEFYHCLPYLGDCNALIFCAPHHNKEAARAEIVHYTGGINPVLRCDHDACLGIDNGADLIEDDNLLFPTKQENLLVWRPHPNAEPEPTGPPPDRFWAHYVVLKIEGRDEKLHLLYLGLRGDHAWSYFLRPHGIPVARLISSRFYQ